MALGKAVCSRSTKDVFPFFLEGVEFYHNIEAIFNALLSMEVKANMGFSDQSPLFRMVFRYLHAYHDILQPAINDPCIIAFELRLETLGSVFSEIRQILAQTGKTSDQIRQDVTLFLLSIQTLAKWDQVYQTIPKRFNMYDRELYYAYDNKWVPRTNNDQEDFNHIIKRPIRKNMGRKDSWFYVEHLGEGVALQQNLFGNAHKVGGTKIIQTGDQCPLERLGVLKSLTVSEIIDSIDDTVLQKCVTDLESHYDVHKWVCRLSKKGIKNCLDMVLNRWDQMFLGELKNNIEVSVSL